MKKIIIVFFSLVIALFYSGNIVAQEKPKTKISSVKQKDGTVRFSLTSSRPFIFGSNRYILHIGNSDFMRNEQSHKNGKGYMTFLVPSGDLNNIRDGAHIYLTYGQVDIEETDMDELSKNSRRCWSLGYYSKDLLTK
jgi:hypothetical protein